MLFDIHTPFLHPLLFTPFILGGLLYAYQNQCGLSSAFFLSGILSWFELFTHNHLNPFFLLLFFIPCHA